MKRFSRGRTGKVIKAATYLLAIVTACVWDDAPQYVDVILGVGLILLVLIGPFPHARFSWFPDMDDLP